MKRRIPSLNWLRVFEAAASTESFARAADRLNMSAAAVSQQIKALEGYVGRPLFTRGARAVSLTDAGRAFLPTVSESLNTVELRAATLFGSVGTEPLTIRATLIFATSWLPERLAKFCKKNPDLSVHVISDASGVDETGEDVELKIVFGDTDRGWAERERLFGETLFPVAASVVANSILTIQDLFTYPLIEIADHRAGWIRWFDANGIDAEDAQFIITDRSDVALSMATSGCGIALARAPATDTMVRRYDLTRCLGHLETTGVNSYYLTYRSQEGLSDGARRFRMWLLGEVT